ncbi:MAG: peptidoglycan-binding protein [Christensenellaceae bacterium]|nr:peptidoglycan-binding protein [Christensenellaceae bacterium]
MKKFVAIVLVLVTVLSIAIPAFALSGSYAPYLGGTGSSYNIRRGHTGDQVKNLQMLLNATMGTHLTLDGIFGSGTEDAVEDFQRNYMGDSNPDGIVGKNTKQALWSACDIWPNLIVVYPQFQ